MCCVTISSLQAAHGTSRELPRALLNHVLFSLILLPSQPSIAIIYTEAVYKCGMAAAMGYHLADLFHGMMESFKLLFAPQSFGSEYELLCTDLSVYLLRIQLWANSIGLSTEDRRPRSLLNPLLYRQDFNETTAKVIESISFLLGELHDIRDKYMLKTLPFDTYQTSAPAKPIQLPRDALKLRAWANQKHKSLFAIARWALRDERRFERKVKRLGDIITALEDVARAGELPPQVESQPELSALLGQDDTPPPYSLAAYSSSSWAVRVPPSDLDSPSSGTIHVNDMAEVTTTSMHRYLFTMDAYLSSFPPVSDHAGPSTGNKLRELSHYQFSELCTDVYDELLRRQEYREPDSQTLPERQSLDYMRNQARMKLSTLITLRFAQLVEDIASEIKRRYPYLQYFSSSISMTHRSPSPSAELSEENRSSTVSIGSCWADGSPSQPTDMPAEEDEFGPSQDNNNTGFFTTYRVKMDDLCSAVLPAVLLKYGIVNRGDEYMLHIKYGAEERKVEMHEKPLQLFKELDRAGKRPWFILRKKAFAVAANESDSL